MYRQIDEDIILKNLDRLEEEAQMNYMSKYEPTLEEINSVYNHIKNFIRERKRIVYGGYAQNALICKQDKGKGFYKPSDLADIEFYTPDPIGDTVDLCDMLEKKGYKHIEGKEGVHNETYKIFVNFHNYCDISYMPENIYNNCPTMEAEDLKMTHPHFMLIDAYRVYNDPMTSYFRLKKTFGRFNTLMKCYPFNDNMTYNKFSYDKFKDSDKINRYIRKHIIHNSKLIVVGHYAFNQLAKMSKAPPTYIIDCPFIQVISDNFEEDLKTISNKLKNNFKNIYYKRYSPFFQFLGKSVEFYQNNNLIFRMYDNNHRCTVYRYSDKKKTYFGTYMLQFMYNLIQYNMAIVRKNNFNIMVYGSMLTRMMKMRDKYLETYNMTVMDKGIFQEFTFDCIGKPVDILRESFLDTIKRREQGKYKFIYKPKGQPGKKPVFRFDNTSGEVLS
jgi:hypothetical protein